MELTRKPLRAAVSELGHSDRERFEEVICGNFVTGELPPQRPNEVRIFVSSTFTDTIAERNALIEKVYPKLKKYCREFNLEFQATDMRWGIQNSSSNDHSTVKLCLDELKKCMSLSIGPFFLGIIGQKYGWRCLPPTIERQIYSAIVETLAEENVEASLLESWYRLDTNSSPNVYILQPIDSILGRDASGWAAVEAELRRKLIFGLSLSVERGKLESEHLRVIGPSVTEIEVMEGLGGPGDKSLSGIVCLRNIEDINEHIGNPTARAFIDKIGEDVDEEASRYRWKLKMFLEKKFDKNSCAHFDVRWRDLHDRTSQEHANYINKFSSYVEKQMMALIRKNLKRWSPVYKDPLFLEVLHHWRIAKTKAETEPSDRVDSLLDYLGRTSTHPFLITGDVNDQGSILLSHCALNPRSPVDYRRTVVVVRFCGMSGNSNTSYDILRSLCDQIEAIRGNDYTRLSQEPNFLVDLLNDVFQFGIPNTRLIIFLSNLDKLRADEDCPFSQWLPADIHESVKMVISTADMSEMVDWLIQPHNAHQLAAQSPRDSLRLIKTLLDKNGRYLTLEQWQIVEKIAGVCPLTFHCKLIVEEISFWKSYDDSRALSLQTTIFNSVKSLFRRLEQKHGESLTKHFLCYITIAKSGLTRGELEDIFSIDDVVLKEIFQFWVPPIRRIPPVILSRLEIDLKSFIIETNTNGFTTLCWLYEEVGHVVRTLYLSDRKLRVQLHRNIAEYYEGTWSGKVKKSFQFSERLVKRLGLSSPDSEACRHVPEQPLEYVYKNKKEWNVRKIMELPYHLYKAREIESLKTNILFSYDFIVAITSLFPVKRVLQNYAHLRAHKDVQLLQNALMMGSEAINLCNVLVGIEISGRLLQYYSSHRMIKGLIDECDRRAVGLNPIVPCWQILSGPGGACQLQHSVDKSKLSDIDIHVVDGKQPTLAVKLRGSDQLHSWLLSTSEKLSKVQVAKGRFTPTNNNDVFFVTITDTHLILMRHDEVIRNWYFGTTAVSGISAATRNAAIFLRNSKTILVDVVKLTEEEIPLSCDHGIFSADESLFVGSTGRLVCLFSLKLRRVLRSVDMRGSFATRLSNLSSTVYSISDTNVYFFGVGGGNPETLVTEDCITQAVLSNSENILLINCKKYLLLFETATNTFLWRIRDIPDKEFTETLAHFEDAGFNSSDSHIIAARHIYICLWSAGNGDFVRLVNTNVSISRILFSSAENRAVTLHTDCSFRMWNLGRVGEDSEDSLTLIRGAVKSVSLCPRGGLAAVASSASHQPVFKLYNADRNAPGDLLCQSDDGTISITSVSFSHSGKYFFVFSKDPNNQLALPWDRLCDVTLWESSTSKRQVHTINALDAVFDPSETFSVTLVCHYYDGRSPWHKSFLAVVRTLGRAVEVKVPLPDGDIVNRPFVLDSRKLCLLMARRTVSTELISQKRETSEETAILLLPLDNVMAWRATRPLEVAKLTSNLHGAYKPYDLRRVTGEEVGLVLVKSRNPFNYDQAGTVSRADHYQKCLIIFNSAKQVVVNVVPRFLEPQVNIETLLISQSWSVAITEDLSLYDVPSGSFLRRLDVGDISSRLVRFVFDGQYIVTFNKSSSTVLLLRTNDGSLCGQCNIGAFGTDICVASDDRTVFVGTNDGRLMMLAIVPDLACLENLSGSLRSRQVAEPFEAVNFQAPDSSSDSETNESIFKEFNLEDEPAPPANSEPRYSFIDEPEDIFFIQQQTESIYSARNFARETSDQPAGIKEVSFDSSEPKDEASQRVEDLGVLAVNQNLVNLRKTEGECRESPILRRIPSKPDKPKFVVTNTKVLRRHIEEKAAKGGSAKPESLKGTTARGFYELSCGTKALTEDVVNLLQIRRRNVGAEIAAPWKGNARTDRPPSPQSKSAGEVGPADLITVSKCGSGDDSKWRRRAFTPINRNRIHSSKLREKSAILAIRSAYLSSLSKGCSRVRDPPNECMPTSPPGKAPRSAGVLHWSLRGDVGSISVVGVKLIAKSGATRGQEPSLGTNRVNYIGSTIYLKNRLDYLTSLYNNL